MESNDIKMDRDDFLYLLTCPEHERDTEIVIRVVNGLPLVRATIGELIDAINGDNEDGDDEEVDGMARLVGALACLGFDIDDARMGEYPEPDDPIIEIECDKFRVVSESIRLETELKELLLPGTKYDIMARYSQNLGIAAITLTGVSDKHMK